MLLRFVTLMLIASYTLGIAEAQEGTLPDQPASGIDADTRVLLEGAYESLKASHPAEAVDTLLLLYAQNNRFATAQRPLLTTDSLRILKAAAEKLDSSGQSQKATQALDAAWQIGGKEPWPEYSQRLFSMAKDMKQTDQGAEALYLTRRAIEVNPTNREALVLDKQLSVNRYQMSAKVLKIAGSVLAGVGLLAIAIPVAYGNYNGGFDDLSNLPDGIQYSLIGGSVTAVVGIGLAVTGALLDRAGRPVERPSSPEYLPAL